MPVPLKLSSIASKQSLAVAQWKAMTLYDMFFLLLLSTLGRVGGKIESIGWSRGSFYGIVISANLIFKTCFKYIKKAPAVGSSFSLVGTKPHRLPPINFKRGEIDRFSQILARRMRIVRILANAVFQQVEL